MRFVDRASVGGTKVTKEGYLVATSRIARTGIQQYRADELGLTGNHIVNVYRPADQVFSQTTLDSLTRIPITVNHPDELVTADNWKDYAVGELGDAWMKDGEWIVVNPMIKDADARSKAETTHKELSAGYTANIDFKDGVAPDGQKYEAVMTDFVFNHLALVPAGRAGKEARIGDSATNWGASPVTTKDAVMDIKTVVIGDKAVQVVATDAETVATLIAAKDAAVGELKAELAIKDAKLKKFEDAEAASLKGKVDDAKAALMADERFGDAAIEGASDAELIAMHKMLKLAAIGDTKTDDTARKALLDKKAADPKDPWAGVIKMKGAK